MPPQSHLGRLHQPPTLGQVSNETQPSEMQTGEVNAGATVDDGETFDLNVSGSDSDEPHFQHQPRSRAQAQATLATEPVDQQINDPDIPVAREKKTAALDIKY